MRVKAGEGWSTSNMYPVCAILLSDEFPSLAEAVAIELLSF